MRKITVVLFFLPFVFFIGCQKDLSTQEAVQPKFQADQSHYYEPSKELLASYDALRTPPSLGTRAACDWVEIPAGSTDALANAINSACEGGVIYLKTGTHVENKAITISKSVKIIGEAGAVLKMKSQLTINDAVTGATTLNPTLHILNAPKTLIQDLDIQPIGEDGATAILLENSNESAIIRCKITKFQYALMVEKSDRVAIMRNTIINKGAWQTVTGAGGESVVVINGKSAYISDNDVSNSLFGIWPCDEWGTCERNNTHGSFIGIILCNVPAGGYVLPSGRGVGAQIPTKNCKVRNNNSTDNQFGYLVIDGANNNLLENNNASRNAAYDIELTTDSYRFGFLTPKSFDNTVNAGSFPNIRIKDCGVNNKVNGGIKINTVTDPCN